MKATIALAGAFFVGVAGIHADDSWIGEGVVVPTHSVSLRARSAQTIAAVVCQIGEQVKKDQVLVRFDDRQAKTDLVIVQLNLKKRQIELKQEEARLAIAKTNVERQKIDLARLKLIAKESGAVSHTELDRSEAELRRSLAELALAETQIELAQVEIEVAKAMVELEELKLDALTIRAPFDGMIVARNCSEGETISKPENPLLEVIAGPYLVEMGVPDRLLMSVKEKPAVEIVLDKEIGAKPITSRISVISAVSDPHSRAIKVQIALPPETQSHVRSGMVVKVKMVVKE